MLVSSVKCEWQVRETCFSYSMLCDITGVILNSVGFSGSLAEESRGGLLSTIARETRDVRGVKF